jgi:hypothetical protein
VDGDILRRGLEQLGHLRLREPDGFVLKAALDARAAILRLVEDDFGIGQGVGHQSVFRNSIFKQTARRDV